VAELWSYTPVAAPIAALAVNVVAQVAQVRLARGRHFLRAVALAFFAGAAALAGIEAWLIARHTLTGETLEKALLVNAPIYAALSYCFFNFVNLGQSSIRIRLYSEIATSTDGVSVAQLSAEYNEESLMRMRLHRLTESGDIVERDGRYFVGRGRLVPIARLIFGLKKFILGKASEFD